MTLHACQQAQLRGRSRHTIIGNQDEALIEQALEFAQAHAAQEEM